MGTAKGHWGKGCQWSRANREASGYWKPRGWQRAEPEGWKETKNQVDKGWGDRDQETGDGAVLSLRVPKG